MGRQMRNGVSATDAASRLTRALESSASDLLAYLERRVGPDDAPDLLGETMVVAWRRVGELPEGDERARMWLFGVARGTLLNHRRGQRRRWALADRIRLQVRESPTSPAADERAEVRDAIDRLVHWERLSLVGAAELLGIPASTARGRYQRAKEKLRVALRVEAPLA